MIPTKPGFYWFKNITESAPPYHKDEFMPVHVWQTPDPKELRFEVIGEDGQFIVSEFGAECWSHEVRPIGYTISRAVIKEIMNKMASENEKGG